MFKIVTKTGGKRTSARVTPRLSFNRQLGTMLIWIWSTQRTVQKLNRTLLFLLFGNRAGILVFELLNQFNYIWIFLGVFFATADSASARASPGQYSWETDPRPKLENSHQNIWCRCGATQVMMPGMAQGTLRQCTAGNEEVIGDLSSFPRAFC